MRLVIAARVVSEREREREKEVSGMISRDRASVESIQLVDRTTERSKNSRDRHAR